MYNGIFGNYFEESPFIYHLRQIELVCIGQYMDKAAVDTALRACLLTDEELVSSPSQQRNMPDPFAKAWGATLYRQKELMLRKAEAADPENIKLLCHFAEFLRHPPGRDPYALHYPSPTWLLLFVGTPVFCSRSHRNMTYP